MIYISLKSHRRFQNALALFTVFQRLARTYFLFKLVPIPDIYARRKTYKVTRTEKDGDAVFDPLQRSPDVGLVLHRRRRRACLLRVPVETLLSRRDAPADIPDVGRPGDSPRDAGSRPIQRLRHRLPGGLPRLSRLAHSRRFRRDSVIRRISHAADCLDRYGDHQIRVRD